MKDDDRIQFNIPVRSLVEFLLRAGDIDDRRAGTGSVSAMRKGAELHRKIQKSMGADYHAEVPLSFCFSCEDYDIVISGRADGIIYVDTEEPLSDVTIDEIKGVARDPLSMDYPYDVHLAQAKCYAFIFALDNKLEEISVQVTYGDLNKMSIKKLKKFHFKFIYDDLESWFLDLIKEYRRWTDFLFKWNRARDVSIRKLKFPFEHRQSQRKLIKNIYASIYRENDLFIQAPTGTGKTIAAVFPAVKAVGEGLADRIFYLTAKTAAKSVAKDTFSLLLRAGLRFKAVELTARDKACPLKERSCNPEDCPYARGHYDRINDALYECITTGDKFFRDDIRLFADEKCVCPFELALDISSWSDAVIGDYNYVFDPNVYLKRFFSEGVGGESIFLIDEAHNLIDRARDMYSSVIVKEDFLSVRKLLKPHGKKVPAALYKCNKLMIPFKNRCDGYSVIEPEEIDELNFALIRAAGLLEKLFESGEVYDGEDEIRDLFFNIRNFLDIAEGMDEEGYRIYCSFDDEGRFFIKLMCIDPSLSIKKRLDMARSAIFFSATLLPVNYYKRLLCHSTDVPAIYTESSFPADRQCVVVGTDVTSLYRRRSDSEYERYACYIRRITGAQRGNYMVFAPSYAFIENIIKRLGDLDGMDVRIQSRDMGEEEREEFLAGFVEESERAVVGFSVMGGAFSEGIDLAGKRLIGAIILGCPLPMVTFERKIIQDFYGTEGFNYAYLYPGMNKVLQAGGRVIRTEKDMGVIALLDERYMRDEYRSIFPREWVNLKTGRMDDVIDHISNFWEMVY